MTNEEAMETIHRIMEENSEIMRSLADDTLTMEAIVARDGCPICKSHRYPCDCVSIRNL